MQADAATSSAACSSLVEALAGGAPHYVDTGLVLRGESLASFNLAKQRKVREALALLLDVDAAQVTLTSITNASAEDVRTASWAERSMATDSSVLASVQAANQLQSDAARPVQRTLLRKDDVRSEGRRTIRSLLSARSAWRRLDTTKSSRGHTPQQALLAAVAVPLEQLAVKGALGRTAPPRTQQGQAMASAPPLLSRVLLSDDNGDAAAALEAHTAETSETSPAQPSDSGQGSSDTTEPHGPVLIEQPLLTLGELTDNPGPAYELAATPDPDVLAKLLRPGKPVLGPRLRSGTTVPRATAKPVALTVGLREAFGRVGNDATWVATASSMDGGGGTTGMGPAHTTGAGLAASPAAATSSDEQQLTGSTINGESTALPLSQFPPGVLAHESDSFTVLAAVQPHGRALLESGAGGDAAGIEALRAASPVMMPNAWPAQATAVPAMDPGELSRLAQTGQLLGVHARPRPRPPLSEAGAGHGPSVGGPKTPVSQLPRKQRQPRAAAASHATLAFAAAASAAGTPLGEQYSQRQLLQAPAALALQPVVNSSLLVVARISGFRSAAEAASAASLVQNIVLNGTLRNTLRAQGWTTLELGLAFTRTGERSRYGGLSAETLALIIGAAVGGSVVLLAAAAAVWWRLRRSRARGAARIPGGAGRGAGGDGTFGGQPGSPGSPMPLLGNGEHMHAGGFPHHPRLSAPPSVLGYAPLGLPGGTPFPPLPPQQQYSGRISKLAGGSPSAAAAANSPAPNSSAAYARARASSMPSAVLLQGLGPSNARPSVTGSPNNSSAPTSGGLYTSIGVPMPGAPRTQPWIGAGGTNANVAPSAPRLSMAATTVDATAVEAFVAPRRSSVALPTQPQAMASVQRQHQQLWGGWPQS